MKKSSLALLLLAGILALPLSAQNDLGLWTSVDGTTKLYPGVKLSVEAEYRMRDNVSATDRASLGASVSYKNPNMKWLKADVGYTFIYKSNPAESSLKYEKGPDGLPTDEIKWRNDDAAYWGAKHRATFSLSGSWKAGRFSLGVRERYQYTYRAAAECDRTRYYYDPLASMLGTDEWYTIDDPASPDYSFFRDTKNPKHDHMLRSRLSVGYDIPKCKFEPFVELEAYNDLMASLAFDKMRYTIGTDYKISKHRKLSAYYRYQDHSDEDEVGGHVIGIGYSFDF